MPKKDTSAAVLGMLSSVGSQTRTAVAAAPPEPAPPPPAAEPEPVTAGPVSALPTHRPAEDAPARAAAPRTLRLRPDTARRLREAWLAAKRDDVLLTAQDFASDLVEEALARHRRRRTAASSG